MQRKKLLLSIVLIGVIAFAVSAGTYAWFFDDEVSTGNKFQTGTIDIEIVELGDLTVSEPNGHNLLKPSQVGYLTKAITNKGNNPARIFKRVRPVRVLDGPLNTSGTVEPEWDTTASILNYIDFDLSVSMGGLTRIIIPYNPGAANNTLLAQVAKHWIELGVLQPGQSMRVIQSFHLRNTGDDTNWAQDDTLLFDEDFQGRQTTGPGGQNGNNPTDGPMWP